MSHLLILFLSLVCIAGLHSTEAKAVNPMISIGTVMVGLRSNGTVVCYPPGNNSCVEAAGWSDIVQISAGGWDSIYGLKSNGTVVATAERLYTGDCYGELCNVGSWRNIIQVEAGSHHVAGLKSDGTVVTAGYCGGVTWCQDVSSWTSIIQISAGDLMTAGLRSDGKIVSTRCSYFGQCNVGSWPSQFMQVSAGHEVDGLYSNGLVVESEPYYLGCIFGINCPPYIGWESIVQIDKNWHVVGLKSNGTAIAACSGCDCPEGACDSVSSWSNVVQVVAGEDCTAGLKSDGSIVCAGGKQSGFCSVVNNWQLIVKIQDSDNDGVADENDYCPNTLYQSIVDSDGCAIIPGDFDVDEKVTLKDCIIGLKILVSDNSNINMLRDTNGDNKLDIKDVIYILKNASL